LPPDLLNAATTPGEICRAASGAGAKGTETLLTLLYPSLEPGATLLSAPIELAGDWGAMVPYSAEQVIGLMRHSCLDGMRTLSDRQPTRLRVDAHASGPPAVWLHPDGSTTAWIIVDIGDRAWSQLAYQFGHELGHVLANSWQPHAKPAAPCQWLEEAIVEAFALRGLRRLARNWKRHPPFPGDSAYGEAIAEYCHDIVRCYDKLVGEQGTVDDVGAWFGRHRSELEAGVGLNPFAQAAALTILEKYEQIPTCVEALGALNRWPARTGLPIPDYLDAWEASCIELRSSPALPIYLRETLQVVQP
jgi:hypothetical protein